MILGSLSEEGDPRSPTDIWLAARVVSATPGMVPSGVRVESARLSLFSDLRDVQCQQY